ncbi:MAG: hypothetical protein ACI9HK_004145, partial [Pirellulaceae bacterium]
DSNTHMHMEQKTSSARPPALAFFHDKRSLPTTT